MLQKHLINYRFAVSSYLNWHIFQRQYGIQARYANSLVGLIGISSRSFAHIGAATRIEAIKRTLHSKCSQHSLFSQTFPYSHILNRKSLSSNSDPLMSNETKENNENSPADTNEDGPHRLDIRVGKVLEVTRHPDADTLYVLKVDLAEAQPRTIISGLVKYLTLDELDQRLVVVLCNLKPSKMRGILSEGMVLCTSNADHTVVEPIIVPPTTEPGSQLAFEGYTGMPDKQLKPKKKLWEKLAADLKTNANGEATWKDAHLMTPSGEHLTSKLINCCIK